MQWGTYLLLVGLDIWGVCLGLPFHFHLVFIFTLFSFHLFFFSFFVISNLFCLHILTLTRMDNQDNNFPGINWYPQKSTSFSNLFFSPYFVSLFFVSLFFFSCLFFVSLSSLSLSLHCLAWINSRAMAFLLTIFFSFVFFFILKCHS